ncbi:MAG: 1-phosphofructokinase [Eubacteriales bacterium]|nr:1-phosphofructokinase [Eubacteriales bacterium]
MITTITLNASIDKAYSMKEAIVNGTVMRVAECRNSAGGKGLNVARIAKTCGSRVLASGMCGGFNGEYLKSMLDQDGIPHRMIRIAGETRSCINILDPKYGSTEYLEPGTMVTAQEEQHFLEQFPELIADSRVVTISGSIPKGMSRDIYGRLIRLAKEAGKKVILDTSGDLLAEGLKFQPTMIKPNRDEIEALFGIEVHSTEDVIEYAKKLADTGIEYVVISLGKDGALLVCKEGVYQGIAPSIQAVNTVGCGDSMVGAFAVALEREYSPEQALTYAIAVASSSAMSPNTGDFDPEVFQRIHDQVVVKKI